MNCNDDITLLGKLKALPHEKDSLTPLVPDVDPDQCAACWYLNWRTQEPPILGTQQPLPDYVE